MGLVDAPDVAPNSRWARATRSIEAFSRRSELPIRLGLGFFPLLIGVTQTPTCDHIPYTNPNVPIQRAHDGVAISQAIAAQSTGNETWTRPALEGALSFAFYWTANDHPGDPPVRLPPSVVLLTAALPSGCGGTVDDLAHAAAASFASTRIRTHVVAIGADAKGLEAVAVAGGTHRVYASPSGDLDEIFARIARSRLVCDVPFEPPFNQPDVSRLEVRARSTNSEPLAVVPKRANPESCGAEGGWFLEPPTNPTTLMLCPATCAAIVDAPAGQVVAGEVFCR